MEILQLNVTCYFNCLYFRKYEQLKYKQNKLKRDIDFLNNCKKVGVYPKFLIFKFPNVSNKDALSIRK